MLFYLRVSRLFHLIEYREAIKKFEKNIVENRRKFEIYFFIDNTICV